MMADVYQDLVNPDPQHERIKELETLVQALAGELKELSAKGQILCAGLEKIARREFCKTLPDPLLAPCAVAEATLNLAAYQQVKG